MTVKEKITIATLRQMKQKGEKITALTAYDASFARILDQQGIDIILVGDSLGMVIQGHTTTLPVTINDMIYHSKAVAKNCQHALLMVDMPFMSYTSLEQALHNAARLMQQGHAEMVKLEGGGEQARIVRKLTHYGIPVCAHLGLQPQSVYKLGGYHVQGRDEKTAIQMLQDAKNLQQAGADALVLECVPLPLARQMVEILDIPVIGIGAGKTCDGQVLVLQDMLGMIKNSPKFTQNFMTTSASIQDAIKHYIIAVKQQTFPTDAQSFL